MPITLAVWGSLSKASGSRATIFWSLNMNMGSSWRPACRDRLTNICQRERDDFSSGLSARAVAIRLPRFSGGSVSAAEERVAARTMQSVMVRRKIRFVIPCSPSPEA